MSDRRSAMPTSWTTARSVCAAGAAASSLEQPDDRPREIGVDFPQAGDPSSGRVSATTGSDGPNFGGRPAFPSRGFHLGKSILDGLLVIPTRGPVVHHLRHRRAAR